MTGNEPSAVLRDVRTLFGPGTTVGLTDRELLDRFIGRRDESAEDAFEALVRRHGPMVWGVCRRQLRDPNDAADAFQATFLVLAHRAGTVRGSDGVGRWLYGVSRKVAARARTVATRRPSSGEEGLKDLAAPAPDPDQADWLAVLDEEIARLPERYRDVVVLCDLDGLSHAEAARQLGCAIGTVGSRASRAKERLRVSLARRGLAPTAGALAGLLIPELAPAAPTPLLASTVRTAILVAEGRATTGTASVAHLAGEVIRGMSVTRWASVAAASLTVLAATCGTVVLALPQPSQETRTPRIVQTPRRQTDVVSARNRNATPSPLAQAQVPDAKLPESRPQDQITNADIARATRLARDVHAESSRIDRLPKFRSMGKYRHGVVDSMRAVDLSLDRFKEALTAPVRDGDWFGWYGLGFSWDEERFLRELIPREANLNFEAQFWTRTDAWERHATKDGSQTNYVRTKAPASFWKSTILFDYSYLRLSPRRFWWGRTARLNGQTMSLVPPETSTWKPLGNETFAGEMCDVVDSPERSERLWIGHKSRLLRGVLSSYVDVDLPKAHGFYQSETIRKIAGRVFPTSYEYGNWLLGEASEDQVIEASIAWKAFTRDFKPSKIRPNELVIFDDYREVAPGLRLPFREIRVFPHTSEANPNKHKLIRSELVVESIRTDVDLSPRFAELMPRDGDPVQDQRFQVAIDLRYKADQPDDEIRKLSEVEYAKRLKGQQFIDGLVKPIAAMVGQPAPALPQTGWVGNRPTDLAGKPYLLHFWATWCGPCKNDLPRLKALAKKGVIIVGMHPAGTPPDEVEAAIRNDGFGHPTFLEAASDRNTLVGGYPSGLFPYYILVDEKGHVAGHGSLTDLLQKSGLKALLGKR